MDSHGNRAGFHMVPIIEADLINMMAMIEAQIEKMNDSDLSWLHKKSKQLSDLCWQEIKRRRDANTDN